MFHALMLLGQIIHAPDIADVALLLVQKHVRCKCRIHQKFLGRICNRHRKAISDRHCEKCRVDIGALRKSERNVGQSADRRQFHLIFAERKCLKTLQRRLRIGTDRRHQSVHHNVLFSHADRFRAS